MKQTYSSPMLTEYGQARSLTLGGGTPAQDTAFVVGSGLITNPTNPVCNPPAPYLGCIPTSGPGSSTNPLPPLP